jgi:copper transport protein
VIAVGVLGLVASSTVAASLHLRLTKSSPQQDQVLVAAPDSVRLWFSEEPEFALSAIGIEGANGKIDVAKVEKTDDATSFKAQVLGDLPPGKYRVTWRTAGSDGHAIRGRYDFEVRAEGQKPR